MATGILCRSIRWGDEAIKAAGLRLADGSEHFTSRPYVPDVAKA